MLKPVDASFFPAAELFPCGQYFFSMLLTLWFEEYFLDDAFLINDKSGPVKAHVLSSIQLLFAPDTKFIDDNMFWVGNQRKGEVIFSFKFFMFFFFIRTYTNNNKSFVSE